MLTYKAYRYRIYPTKEQEKLIIKTFGCARFVFNYFLALTEHTYEEEGKFVPHRERSAMLPKLKAIEDLKAKNLLKNHCLAKSIQDAGWRLFVKLLEYKCRWYGKELSRINQWFPSSQLCSSCGAHTGKKPLSVRAWTCSECGVHHDRDVNAALNILCEGTRISLKKANVSS